MTANGLGRGTRSIPAGGTVQLPFDDSGLWRLSVTRSGAPTVVHEVRILGGGFPDEDPALLLGRSRSWPCQQLPAAAVLSTDGALSLTRSGAAFPPASRWPLRFLHPDGSSAPTCHSIQAFQNGRLIGDAHSNLSTTPQEVK